MKYHVTLARNDVFGELTGLRLLYSLDDFHEPSYCKKKTWHAKFLYTTRLIGVPT